MNKISDLKKGIKAKECGVIQFSGKNLINDRQKWLGENPEIIIFNTHVYINSSGEICHVFEYIKNLK
jgi:hypothetical protein